MVRGQPFRIASSAVTSGSPTQAVGPVVCAFTCRAILLAWETQVLKVEAQIYFYCLSLKFLRGQHQKDGVSGGLGGLGREVALGFSMSRFHGHRPSFLGDSALANFAFWSCWLSFVWYTCSHLSTKENPLSSWVSAPFALERNSSRDPTSSRQRLQCTAAFFPDISRVLFQGSLLRL